MPRDSRGQERQEQYHVHVVNMQHERLLRCPGSVLGHVMPRDSRGQERQEQYHVHVVNMQYERMLRCTDARAYASANSGTVHGILP